MRNTLLAFIIVLIAAGAWLLFAGDDPAPAPAPAIQESAEVAEEAAPAEEAVAQAEETVEPEPEPEEPLPMAETFQTHEDEIVAAMTGAPWTSIGNDGAALYMIAFRSCPTCLAFKAGEHDVLTEAGVDIRYIVYARRDREGRERSSTEERAVQAELWLTRDWSLFEAWYATDPDTYYVTAQLPPVAEEDPEREAAVEEARALVDQLAELYAANDIDLAIPTLLWQQDGVWMTYVGYDEATFAPVREYLIEASAE